MVSAVDDGHYDGSGWTMSVVSTAHTHDSQAVMGNLLCDDLFLERQDHHSYMTMC